MSLSQDLAEVNRGTGLSEGEGGAWIPDFSSSRTRGLTARRIGAKLSRGEEVRCGRVDSRRSRSFWLSVSKIQGQVLQAHIGPRLCHSLHAVCPSS